MTTRHAATQPAEADARAPSPSRAAIAPPARAVRLNLLDGAAA